MDLVKTIYDSALDLRWYGLVFSAKFKIWQIGDQVKANSRTAKHLKYAFINKGKIGTCVYPKKGHYFPFYKQLITSSKIS